MSKNLKIISWNVHFPDFARDSSYVVNQLEKSGPFEVICLQEYVEGADDKLKQWLQDNDFDITYLPFSYNANMSQGIMTACSKALRSNSESVTLREDEPKRFRPFHNIRGLIDTSIRFAGREVSIANTHLTYSRFHTRDMRRREFGKLQEHLAAESGEQPFFICGDFNFFGNDSRREYLVEHYQSFTGDRLKTWQHQAKFSPLRANLDYFFWEDDKLNIKASIGGFNVSDHRPLFAEISCF